MYNFDASAIVDLWDNYPFNNEVFKPLWGKFVENIEKKVFVISDIALNETKSKIDSNIFNGLVCDIKIYKKEVRDLTVAQSIKLSIEIEGDNYGEGVGENDIFIVAISKRIDAILVTNENRQPSLPQIKSKYKMPAVCGLQEVSVKSINLTELLHESPLWQCP
ncbi:DUF4411 family protein [Bathymodiolus septemdierum thioautotrophic gill symbiont]|uniref:PIN domain-containing protein n=1 Tax=endosymbiont of Bathymodiolus septemdierum str. Myojin knoll TaxID=1303921 RepID=A0A0N7KBN1_9GAMM|nr:DUF4411 family protein [Bathymodiolus septemdierum thioautotrophic gill symbiont]BAS68479.1 conserved hypothetical protein [endosymbiont of Bathymodiolus septemdierum str. Myojin knoll]